jgi:hypothetical protein
VDWSVELAAIVGLREAMRGIAVFGLLEQPAALGASGVGLLSFCVSAAAGSTVEVAGHGCAGTAGWSCPPGASSHQRPASRQAGDQRRGEPARVFGVQIFCHH